MKRIARNGALGLLVIVALAVALRSLWQYENAQALAIHTHYGIEEVDYFHIGGIDQWVQIRGDDRHNPVILFMHGGPGASESAVSSLFRSWEKYFTVVMWDQRCAGKTMARNGVASCKGMSVKSVAQDGIELTENLRRYLHANKIILVGHSWGTMIGVRMAKERPDLFSAFVGTGFVVSIPEKEPILYADTLARLHAAGDESGIKKLQAIGPPPYKTWHGITVQRDLSEKYDIASERDLFSNLLPVAAFAPGWSLWDLYWLTHSSDYTEDQTYYQTLNYDARALGPGFKLPFFIINGALDRVTPARLAKAYFDGIRAPHKEFVAIPDAGHSAVLTKPDDFLRVLVTRVRPYAIQNENGAPHG